MKEIFEVLEAEVHQHVVDRKHDEIERKNLFIANDNLIADCLFKEVFHVATNSELNVSSFTEMHDAYTSLKARCLELEVELSNLRDKIEKDNHDELIKRFSNLEDQVKPKVLAPGKYAIDVEPIHPHNRNNREVHLVYLKHLKESVETLREIVAKAKAERPLDSSLVSACRYTKHSQELLEYMIGTYPKGRSLAHVVQIVLWYLDSGCSKHMTGDRSRLKNFVKKFTGTVRFGNDHFGAIMGYGDYVIGESVDLLIGFTWVKFLRSKDETPEDSYRRDSTENSVVERRNRTLVEAARTMLIFSKSMMFLWAEAVAIACYT
ncbi:integrase, catalytic region, zinc finger, CCHC-type containing protein [Tanacetum coccineum]